MRLMLWNYSLLVSPEFRSYKKGIKWIFKMDFLYSVITLQSKYTVPLLEKEGLGEIIKINPPQSPFSKGEVYVVLV